MTDPSGRLAIWNRCAPGREAEYEAWYQSEHLQERLAVPGFRRGRRYEVVGEPAGYFTYYEVDTSSVLTSETYLERVNNPTTMTAQIMRSVFTDMNRTACDVSFIIGEMRGSHVLTLQMSALPSETLLQDWVGSGGRASLIARIEGWQATDEVAPQSAEARLRGGDRNIAACLIVETLREPDCRSVGRELSVLLNVPVGTIGTYRLICELAH